MVKYNHVVKLTMTMKEKCFCCGKDAIFDEEGNCLNFCSQRCADSNVEMQE